MRPAKKVMILARSVKTESVLRFLLTVRLFDVFATNKKSEAVKELNRSVYDCLLVEAPSKFDVVELNLGYRIPVIGFGGNSDIPNAMEDHHVPAGDDFAFRLIHFIKLVCARKRGPKKGYVPQWRKVA